MEKFILLALATWRMSSLLVQENGPGDIFKDFKAWVAQRSQETDNFIWNNISEGIHCIWCSSVWISSVMSLFMKPDNLLWWIIFTCALSAVSIIINSYVMRDN